MPNPYATAGAKLGQLLLGGNKASQEKAYQEGLQRGYTIDRAMQEAGTARSKRLIAEQQVSSREALANTAPGEDLFVDMGYSPEHARFARAFALSQNEPDLRPLGDVQRPGAREAIELAKGVLGDDVDGETIVAANRAQQYLAGKQFDPVTQEGGVLRNVGFALGEPGFQVQSTPEAAARIAQGNQRVDIAQQKANRGPAPRGGAGGKPPSSSQVESQVLADARARIAKGADPARVAAYLTSKGYPGVAKKIYTAPKPSATLGDDGY